MSPRRLLAVWEERLVREGLPDPDRYVDRQGRLQRRAFAVRRGDGGRVVERRGEEAWGRLPVQGRGEGGDVRAGLASVDLRHRGRGRRTGRPGTVFPPGVRRKIAELHAAGSSLREICKVLDLRVSYGTVRRVLMELVALRRQRRQQVGTLEALVRAADPSLVRRLRGKTLEELEGDPVVMDLLAEDRRTVWDLTLDGRHRPTRRRAIFPEI